MTLNKARNRPQDRSNSISLGVGQLIFILTRLNGGGGEEGGGVGLTREVRRYKDRKIGEKCVTT